MTDAEVEEWIEEGLKAHWDKTIPGWVNEKIILENIPGLKCKEQFSYIRSQLDREEAMFDARNMAPIDIPF